MRRLSQLNEEIALWSNLESSVGNLADLIDLSVETGDLSLEGQIVSEISDIRSRLDRLEFNLALNGKYDRGLGSRGHSLGGRWDGVPGLGRDTDADVSTVGVTPRVGRPGCWICRPVRKRA